MSTITTAVRSRLAVVVLAVCVAGATTACRAVTRVSLTVHPGGDGAVAVTLTLDHEAAARFGDLRAALRLDDLSRAGWAIRGPVAGPDGSQAVTVTRAFRSVSGAEQAIQDLSGPAGPFHGLQIEVRRGLLSSRFRVHGDVDLRAGPDAFGDDRLRQRLGVNTLADALAVLGRVGGTRPDLAVELNAGLPGSIVASNAPRRSGGSALWSPALGEQTTIDVQTYRRNTRTLLLLGLAAVLGVALGVVLVQRAFGLGGGGGKRWWSRLAKWRKPRRRDSWEIGSRSRRGSASHPSRAGWRNP